MTTAADERLEELTTRLRSSGFKMTAPRRAVLAELVAHGSEHVSAEELAAAVRRRQPDIEVSTVYRTLSTLRELGVLQHTHLGHGGAVYHLGETHQHLVCEQCGAIIDVPLTELEGLTARLRDAYGFELHAGHSALLGRCADHPVGSGEHAHGEGHHRH